MRKRTVFILLICPNICLAQNNKLNGIVVEQSSGSKPVAEVRIFANRANVTLSATDGRFILTFQSLNAGDNIGVSVQKEGWEVVNEKELSDRSDKKDESEQKKQNQDFADPCD